jgi:hypothetical protein
LIFNEMALRGKPRPVAITECGVALTEDEWKDPASHWRRRTFPWARFLISMLDRPDKVITVQAHDLSAVAGEWYKFLADDNDGFSMSSAIETKKLQTQPPTYWLYWLLRHTRGTRLLVEGGVSDMTIFATRRKMIAEDEAAAFLINDRDVPQPVQVNFAGLPSATITHWDRLYFNSASKIVIHESGDGVVPVMPPHSLAVAYVAVPVTIPVKAELERVELLGEKVLQEFPERSEASVTIPVDLPLATLQGVARLCVCIGIQGNDTKDEITMVVDGESYPLKGGVFFQKQPLPKLPASGKKDLHFNLVHRNGNHRLRISFVSFVVERSIVK